MNRLRRLLKRHRARAHAAEKNKVSDLSGKQAVTCCGKNFTNATSRRKARLSKRKIYKNVFIEIECIENALRLGEESAVAQVHNLVGTCQLKSKDSLNLEVMSRFMPNSQYEKQKFASITIHLGSPQCTMLLFTSVKMVLT